MFRDAESFPEFPKMAGIDPLHQDRLFQAIGVEAISAMEWRWLENWRVGPRVINDSMWFWFESGNGSGWTVNSKNRFHYKAGDAILIPQGVEHFLDQDKGATAHVYAVHFNVHLFSAMNPLTFLGVPTLIRDTGYRDLGSLLEAVIPGVCSQVSGMADTDESGDQHRNSFYLAYPWRPAPSSAEFSQRPASISQRLRANRAAPGPS